MSGGCYQYFYSHVRTFTDEMKADTPLRRKFRTHLKKVALACREIEWQDSGDGGNVDKAITSVFNHGGKYAKW